MTKPPYSVMTMEEIRAVPWNGFNAVSTFSGCGGSSTGYRMAGFKMLWASEFVPAAQDTYRANAAPYTVLDTQDIRDVTGDGLLAACGLGTGEIDLFDGSPPCAAFSSVGKLDEGWGKVKKYSDTEQRVDDLFFEYARLIKETQPRVFVAENVAGLVRGVAKGYFLEILRALKACGYRVTARVLNAAWLGVPQVRNRLIIVGVRKDLAMAPVHPSPLPYQYTVRDVLPYIALQGANTSYGKALMRPPDLPSGPFGAGFTTGNGLCPSGMVVDSKGYGTMRPANEPSPALITSPTAGHGAGIVSDGIRVIHDLRGTRQSLSKGDVTDSPVPPFTTQTDQTLVDGDHGSTVDPETGQELSMVGYAVHEEWSRLRPGEHSKKYFHVRRQHLDQQYDTVMAGQGVHPESKTGPSHWTEPRKLNLLELRALAGFPPDFVLTGTYAQRWERVGRAVPPVMMNHIATAVRDHILLPLREAGTI